MAPPTVQNVALAGALLYAVVILIASAASKDLLFPMSPTGSAADLAIVSGLLAVSEGAAVRVPDVPVLESTATKRGKPLLLPKSLEHRALLFHVEFRSLLPVGGC